MTSEQEQALQAHIEAIAKILYQDTQENAPEQLRSLAGIEEAVRSQMQKHVMPEVGVFLSQLRQAQMQAIGDDWGASWGNFPSPASKPNA